MKNPLSEISTAATETDLIEKISVNLKNKQIVNIEKAKIAEDTPKNTPKHHVNKGFCMFSKQICL